jgi:hypothetical protein
MFEDIHNGSAFKESSDVNVPAFEEAEVFSDCAPANQPLVTNEDSKLQLGFLIDHFFLLGSPLGLFVSVYNE